MGLETATYISQLVPANPPGTDAVSQGDDHLRMIKQVLQNSFPSLDKPLHKWRIEAISADETALASDDATLYNVDASGAARTVNLPAASGNAGVLIGVKKADASANTVTLDASASELIDGQLTLVLANRYDAVWVLCDGTGWVVVINARNPNLSTAPTIKVRAVSRANVNRATAMASGQTFDGITLATGDLLLLTGQTAPADNGIYLVPASGTSNRAPGFTTWDSMLGSIVLAIEGTTNGDTVWRNKSGLSGTIGTTAITYSQILTVDDFSVVEADLSRDDYLLGINGASGATRLVDVGDLPGVRQLHVRDERSNNTSGGSISGGTWNTRTLNTVRHNSISGASLSANRFTLPEGTYDIDADVPAFFQGQDVGANAKGSLYNVTDSSYVIIGTSQAVDAGSNPGSGGQFNSRVRGRFSITGTKSFEIRHYASRNISGGAATDAGSVEVYTDVVISKVE